MRFYGLVFATGVFMLALRVLLFNISPAVAQELRKAHNEDDCGYYMCQYEKGNVDTVIIEHAKTCQTVMFGEIHDSVVKRNPAPVEDSLYVITLLLKLKEVGYEYIALEVNKHALEQGHSHDIVRFCENYKNGESIKKEQYPDAKPGWIELVKEAIDFGYKIRFTDVDQKSKLGSFPRDRAMFEEMKREIFDVNEKAKVIVYIGANHISEYETDAGVSLCMGKMRPLGYLLDKYTKGGNFSVYMGHTYDTPEGCDLFISYFIRDPCHKKMKSEKDLWSRINDFGGYLLGIILCFGVCIYNVVDCSVTNLY
jgi:hypothetical protein